MSTLGGLWPKTPASIVRLAEGFIPEPDKTFSAFFLCVNNSFYCNLNFNENNNYRSYFFLYYPVYTFSNYSAY